MIAMILAIALGATATDADNRVADPPTRYTPEIRGQLLDGAKAVSSNVCLRQSGSEIRMCGYTDFSGTFYIPRHSVHAAPGDDRTPTYWLEVGRVTEAKKITPIDASGDQHASIALECNLARAAGKDDTVSVCDRRSAAEPSRVTQTDTARRRSSAHPKN
jgi:hypothetical protein